MWKPLIPHGADWETPWFITAQKLPSEGTPQQLSRKLYIHTFSAFSLLHTALDTPAVYEIQEKET